MELGFEVQVTVALSDGSTPWVQMSRNEFRRPRRPGRLAGVEFANVSDETVSISPDVGQNHELRLASCSLNHLESGTTRAPRLLETSQSCRPHEFERADYSVSTRNDRLLAARSVLPGSIFGWIAISICFIAWSMFVGGPTTNDSDVTVFTAWSLGHGHMACAYLPQGFSVIPPTAPPSIRLFSGAITALFQVGHRLPFPTSTQLGPHCVTATAAIYQWAFHSGAFAPTLRIGYVAWFVSGGWLHRLSSRLGTRPLWLGVSGPVLTRVLPPVSMCSGGVFPSPRPNRHGTRLGRSGVCPSRDAGSGRGTLGPGRLDATIRPSGHHPAAGHGSEDRLLRLSSLGRRGGADRLPLAILSSGRAIVGVVVGTGASSTRTRSSISRTFTVPVFTWFRGCYLSCSSRAWLVGGESSRILGLEAGAAGLSGGDRFCAFRLIFEVNFWGYYLMAMATSLAALDLLRGRFRLTFGAWLLAILLVSLNGGLVNTGHFSWLPDWIWQAAFVPTGLGLALAPLLTFIKDHRQRSTASESRTSP